MDINTHLSEASPPPNTTIDPKPPPQPPYTTINHPNARRKAQSHKWGQEQKKGLKIDPNL